MMAFENTITIDQDDISSMSSMISALKLSPSCMCSEEAVQLFGLDSTAVIDVRKADCDKDYSMIKNVHRLPYDEVDVVDAFLSDSLAVSNTENITHFILVCDHGYRSENIARLLNDKGIEGVYHLCGGYRHHHQELMQNPSILARNKA